ncbi:MAG: ATP-dependent zinc metalloprotease FtsH [Bacilli bacterium]|nr:ATP-dependent zinc metalloprotease FtsH [Bacilli bacterium]
MDQERRQRRGFGSFIPYFLIVLAVGAFVWMIVALTGNKTTRWDSNRSNLYQKINENHIQCVEVFNKETMYEISGKGTDKENNAITFTFTCDAATFNTEFDKDPVTSEVIEPTTIRAELEKAVERFQAEFPKEKEKSYFRDEYAFNVSFWDAWGPTIITLVFTVLIAIFLFSRLSSSVNGANNKAMDFGRSRARKVENSKVRFSDVAGCDEEKAEMQELVEYLKEPGKFTKFGAKLPKGILLVGNPGTGKTLLAKAVAGEAGVPFFSISGSDFVEMFVGVGAGRVRDMFRKAKACAPCLVFIDEIDAVGRQRGAGLGGGNDEREQTLNQLLVEMDGFEDNSGIIVIAATNRDDVLDPALLRAGRFDRTITVNLPDKKGREAIFKVHSRNKLIDPKVDFEALAKRTVGFSGADIENIMNEAAILAVRGNKPMIGIKEIDEAIDRRIAGPAKSSKGLNEKERKQVAYHEAGHAIIGLKLKDSDKVQKITIIPRGRTGGHVLMTPEDDRFLLSKAELEARIIGYLGGRSSEEIFFKDVSTGASNDIEVATRIARMMVTEYGMSSLGPIQYEHDTGSVFLGRDYTSTQRNFSTQVAYEIDTEVRKIIDEAHKKALDIIEKNKKEVILIAETLLEQETITAEEIDVLLKEGTLKKEAKKEQVNEEPKPKVKKEVKEEPKVEEKVKPEEK